MYSNSGFYQSPYTQPMQNPYMDRLAQMQTQPQQPPRDGLIRVTGMEGARAYQMPPNSAVALFDGGQDIFYVKTTDGAGFPTIRSYAFTPLQDQAATPSGDYVTRAEFNALKEMIEHGQQPVREQPESAQDGRAK